MSLEDDLSDIVKSNQETLEEAWSKKRRMVQSRFGRTANALDDDAGGQLGRWKVVLVNGNVALTVQNGEVDKLSFSIDESARQVLCEATVSRPGSSGFDTIEVLRESFDIDKLTESEVDRKIREFVDWRKRLADT